MNSAHVIFPELSLSMPLKKSASSADVNGSFNAMANVFNSRLLIKPSLSLSNWSKILLMAKVSSGVNWFITKNRKRYIYTKKMNMFIYL